MGERLRKFGEAVVIVGGIFGAGVAGAADKTCSQIASDAAVKLNAVSYVDKDNNLHIQGVGTGTIIGDNGEILSTYHTFKDNLLPVMETLEGDFPLKVIRYDKKNDLILLQGPDLEWKATKIMDPEENFNNVVIAGYPHNSFVLSKGGKSNITKPFHLKEGTAAVSAEVKQGNSGGPVIDCNIKKIAGVVAGIIPETNEASIITADTISKFMESNSREIAVSLF